jgi:hypothetical protein
MIYDEQRAGGMLGGLAMKKRREQKKSIKDSPF